MVTVNGASRPGDEPIDQLTAAVDAGGAQRWAALAALGDSPDPRAFDLLVTYASAPDWTVRRAAVEALGKRGRDRDVEPLLRARLRDASPAVVRAACEASGSLGLHALHAEVTALLGDRDPATRRAALSAVGALWTANDAARMRGLYENDPDPGVRRDAARMLRERAEREWWPALVALWRDDPLARHRVWACELAAATGDRAATRESIAPLLADRDGHVRKAARRALGEPEPPGA